MCIRDSFKYANIPFWRVRQKHPNRINLHAYSWNNNAKRLYERNGFNEYAVSYETFI